LPRGVEDLHDGPIFVKGLVVGRLQGPGGIVHGRECHERKAARLC